MKVDFDENSLYTEPMSYNCLLSVDRAGFKLISIFIFSILGRTAHWVSGLPRPGGVRQHA